MPELPEVETVARQLAPLVTGRRVRRLQIIDRERLVVPGARRLAGRTVAAVFRSGKQVVLQLRGQGGDRFLAVHLRMTGRLLHFPAGADRGALRHVRARLLLERGEVRFQDTRRFGTMAIHDALESLAPAGVEPLDPALTAARLGELIGETRQALKPWLLRQDRLVGLGNIYASEILHAAALHPERPAGTLDAQELRRLHRALRRILRRAIDCCGTTFSDFQDARGLEGEFQNCLAVYGREGQPCGRCGGTVVRRVQGQRSTYFCPECQPPRLVD